MPTRKKIFETNSSSSHSIVCDGVTDYVTIEKPEDWIYISGGEYGWGVEELHHFAEKISYAYTYAKLYGTDSDLTMLRDVIRDFMKIEPEFAPYDEKKSYWYIDHQSFDYAKEIFDSPEKLKIVLFGVGSYILIDNDNHL